MHNIWTKWLFCVTPNTHVITITPVFFALSFFSSLSNLQAEWRTNAVPISHTWVNIRGHWKSGYSHYEQTSQLDADYTTIPFYGSMQLIYIFVLISNVVVVVLFPQIILQHFLSLSILFIILYLVHFESKNLFRPWSWLHIWYGLFFEIKMILKCAGSNNIELTFRTTFLS